MALSKSKISPLRILTAPIRLALFDPRVTAPLLVAILYYPEKLRGFLPANLHPLITSPALIKTLKAFLTLGITRAANSKLSQLVYNNWKSPAKFVKSQELVLISGGCSGIGQLMAQDFAKFGVKVVVLDLNPPKEALRTSLLPFQEHNQLTNKPSIKRLLLPHRCHLFFRNLLHSNRNPQRSRGPYRAHQQRRNRHLLHNPRW